MHEQVLETAHGIATAIPRRGRHRAMSAARATRALAARCARRTVAARRVRSRSTVFERPRRARRSRHRRHRRAALFRVRHRRRGAGHGRPPTGSAARGIRTRALYVHVAGRRGDGRHRRRAGSLELLGLPRTASVGFVTGCHMANFTCLAAARHEVLRRAGWNVETHGLQTRAARPRARRRRSPRLRGRRAALSRVRHRRDRAGAGRRSGPHARGRARRARSRDRATGPTIVCAQAGNVSTGASDPIDAIVAMRARARRLGARRRRVRPVGGRGSGTAIAGDGHRDRRLVGDRRAQVAERARTTRASRSSPTPRRIARR